jgi:hypothetical protein
MKLTALDDVIKIIKSNNKEVEDYSLTIGVEDFLTIECISEYKGLLIIVSPVGIKNRMFLRHKTKYKPK